MADVSDIRETVRDRYAKLARDAAAGEDGCCAPAGCGSDHTDLWGSGLYDEDSRKHVPDAAVSASTAGTTTIGRISGVSTSERFPTW